MCIKNGFDAFVICIFIESVSKCVCFPFMLTRVNILPRSLNKFSIFFPRLTCLNWIGYLLRNAFCWFCKGHHPLYLLLQTGSHKSIYIRNAYNTRHWLSSIYSTLGNNIQLYYSGTSNSQCHRENQFKKNLLAIAHVWVFYNGFIQIKCIDAFFFDDNKMDTKSDDALIKTLEQPWQSSQLINAKRLNAVKVCWGCVPKKCNELHRHVIFFFLVYV